MISSITYLDVPSDEHVTRSRSSDTRRLPSQHGLRAVRNRSGSSYARKAVGVPNIGYVELPTHVRPS